ncbi:MAG TPA: hypothetical protein VHK87_03155 [Phenylobacterium sp.]|nr:hypothetical protein [Phenylobacterium sp.]HEX2559058.1 hypothetical protein [Phenylobacterium sp.]
METLAHENGDAVRAPILSFNTIADALIDADVAGHQDVRRQRHLGIARLGGEGFGVGEQGPSDALAVERRVDGDVEAFRPTLGLDQREQLSAVFVKVEAVLPDGRLVVDGRRQGLVARSPGSRRRRPCG